MRQSHHRSDVSDADASRVQVGVDVLGDMVRRPTPAEIVANELRHPDHGGVMLGRPVEARGAQLSEVPVIKGIGSRNSRATHQAAPTTTGTVNLASQRGEGIVRIEPDMTAPFSQPPLQNLLRWGAGRPDLRHPCSRTIHLPGRHITLRRCHRHLERREKRPLWAISPAELLFGLQ